MIYIRYSQFSIFIINNKNKQTKSFLKDKILIIKWTRLSKLEIEKFMFSTVNIHMCALSFSSIDRCSFSLFISCSALGHQTNKYMEKKLLITFEIVVDLMQIQQSMHVSVQINVHILCDRIEKDTRLSNFLDQSVSPLICSLLSQKAFFFFLFNLSCLA